MTIDRITPTRRPDGPPFGHQQWWDLLFLHWEVDASELQRRLPFGLTIDTFEGRAFVGLVPFRMAGIRPRGLPPLPYFSAFGEVNLRTYVHHEGRDPGVFFFSLEASRLAAVVGARSLWALPYYWSEVRHRAVDPGRTFETTSHAILPHDRRAELAVRWTLTERLGPSAPGTLEHFLLERYGLYSATRSGTLRHARVHHHPYEAFRAEVALTRNSLLEAAGIHGEPLPLVLASPGVDVEVFPLRKVT